MKRHTWTDDERLIVRRDFSHTHTSRVELARRLSFMTGDTITEFAIAGQVQIMGIAKRDDRRRWTPEEERRLVTLIPRFGPRDIAKMMHRSLNSVVVKAQRLHASRRVRNDWFTKMEVCEILGVDHHWVQRRIDCGALVATSHHGIRPQQNGGASWHIEAKALRNFIRRYPDELTAKNVDLVFIVELLAGILSGNGVNGVH